MAKNIDNTNLGYLKSKMDDTYWPKADIVQIGLDNAPALNSDNLVKSGGVYSALQGKQGVIDSTHKLDYSLIDNQPTIPTVPTISTNIANDSASDAKTASPKAVADYAVQCLIPGLKLWAGTEAEYNQLTPSNDTVYVIKSTT